MDNLPQVFNFTADDLALNMAGKLSPNQEDAIAREVRHYDILSIMLIILWGGFFIPLMVWFFVHGEGLIRGFLLVFGIGLIFKVLQPRTRETLRYYVDWRRNWRAGTLITLDGIRTADFTQLRERDNVYYSRTLGDSAIMLSSTEYAALQPDRTYQLFVWVFRGEPQRLLSVREMDASQPTP